MANRNDLETAVNVYTWATIEAKNLLRCISIATDHAEGVADELRPVIGIAIDGVARLLGQVQRQLEHIDVGTDDQAAGGGQ